MATVTPQQQKRDLRIKAIRDDIDALTSAQARPPLKAVLRKIVKEISNLKNQE